MRTSREVVRPRRTGSGRAGSAKAGPVVAVTGASSGLGHALAARLSASAAVRKVVAIDAHRGDVEGVTWRVIDVRDPRLAGRLADVDIVVHLALDVSLERDPRERRAFNVRATQTALTASAASGVRRVVLLSSAMVYGAVPDNPVPLDEDAPLRAVSGTGLVGDFLEIEQLAAQSPRTHPGLAVTVLRPAALVGPGVDTIVTRHFESPRLLAVKGGTPRWQFCHIDDLLDAIEITLGGEVDGAAAVGCDGWLEEETIEEISGLRRFELPAVLTFGTAERLHRLGVTPAPASELHFVVHPWVVRPAKLPAAGWCASYDNELALEALMEEVAGRHAVAGRRLARKEATITAAGAAGATAAAIGTAALIRRRRRGRG
ncbi:MAG: NAD-dependent epimerase/dehydratase family protein [Streptosporangiaceae bacterium]